MVEPIQIVWPTNGSGRRFMRVLGRAALSLAFEFMLVLLKILLLLVVLVVVGLWFLRLVLNTSWSIVTWILTLPFRMLGWLWHKLFS